MIALGGTGVPIPAPGCADGTANTQTGIPTLLPIVCNADDSGSGTQATTPYGVREALDVFALATQTPERGATDNSRDCAEGITSEGSQSCSANAASAIKARGTLPFTGMNLLDLSIAGVALLGAGLLLRRRFGAHA